MFLFSNEFFFSFSMRFYLFSVWLYLFFQKVSCLCQWDVF